MIEITDQGRWLVSIPGHDILTVANRADAERVDELFAALGDVRPASSYDKTLTARRLAHVDV